MKRSQIIRQVLGLQVGGGGEVALQEGASKGEASKKGTSERKANKKDNRKIVTIFLYFLT